MTLLSDLLASVINILIYSSLLLVMSRIPGKAFEKNRVVTKYQGISKTVFFNYKSYFFLNILLPYHVLVIYDDIPLPIPLAIIPNKFEQTTNSN